MEVRRSCTGWYSTGTQTTSASDDDEASSWSTLPMLKFWKRNHIKEMKKRRYMAEYLNTSTMLCTIEIVEGKYIFLQYLGVNWILVASEKKHSNPFWPKCYTEGDSIPLHQQIESQLFHRRDDGNGNSWKPACSKTWNYRKDQQGWYNVSYLVQAKFWNRRNGKSFAEKRKE